MSSVDAVVKEKLSQARAIMAEEDVDVWLILVRETAEVSDPVLPLVYGSDFVWTAAVILDREGRHTVVCGAGDSSGVEARGLYPTVVGYHQDMRPSLLEALDRLAPHRIGINYSKFNNIADGLPHGLYLHLTEDLLCGTPWLGRLVTADALVSKLRGRKSAEEVCRIRAAIARTEELLRRLGEELEPGQSEKEIFDWLQGEMKRLELGHAWSPEYNPILRAGPNSPGGHGGPTGIRIRRGDVLRTDFGVRSAGYCGDLQRSYYFLREGEDRAPADVQRALDTVVLAIDRAAAALRPGVLGWQVDQVARDTLAERGYPEFMHALGHQLGRMAHDGGGLLAPRWERYGDRPALPVEKDQVYTLELDIMTSAGVVALEENVVVTVKGCEFLSERQRQFILVR